MNNIRSLYFKHLSTSHTLYHKSNGNILLFFSGYSRKSSKILEEQTIKTNHNDKEMIANLER